MENQFNNTLTDQTQGIQERPAFLKVLCILSFVMCGLAILVFTFGAVICLSLNADAVSEVWDKVIASQPLLEGIDPMQFFNSVGKLCLYYLMGNITSLLGVVMMWRLNRNGFFIYAAAELVTNFFGYAVDMPGQSESYSGLIFYMVVDAVFIMMYALNLKHMRK